MAIIEKKYLLKDSIHTLLDKYTFSKKNISQFYTKIKPCKEIRYRKDNETFIKTVRTGKKIRKDIVEKEISQAKYLAAKDKKIGIVVKKERFTLVNEFPNFAIDCYKKDLKSLNLLEVTFKSQHDAQEFSLPEEFQVHVLKDISHDDRYRNKNLAQLGNPKKISYNIYSIFKDIEKERFTSAGDVIFPEMMVSDAMRIILYQIHHALKVNRDKLLLHNDIYALVHFRKHLKQAITLLEEYHHIFDHTMYKKVLSHLHMINKTIAVDKDLTLIRANLRLLESAFSEKDVNFFIARMDKRIEEEKHKVKIYFKTRKFAIMFHQVDLLLKEQSNIHNNYYANTTINEVVKSSVNKHFTKLLYLTKKYDKCHDNDSYKKMNKALYKTQTIVHHFAHLYDKQSYKEIQRLLQESADKFEEFINANKRALIIKTYIRNFNKDPKEQKKLIKKVQKKRIQRERLLNAEIDAQITLLRKNKSLFKK